MRLTLALGKVSKRGSFQLKDTDSTVVQYIIGEQNMVELQPPAMALDVEVSDRTPVVLVFAELRRLFEEAERKQPGWELCKVWVERGSK